MKCQTGKGILGTPFYALPWHFSVPMRVNQVADTSGGVGGAVLNQSQLELAE